MSTSSTNPGQSGQFQTANAFASWYASQVGKKYMRALSQQDLTGRLNWIVTDVERLVRRRVADGWDQENCLEQPYDPTAYGLSRAVVTNRCSGEVIARLRQMSVRDLLKLVHTLKCYSSNVEDYASYLHKLFTTVE